ncbi:hypothetical protein [Sorangium sp. So ce1099]|uniref:hypothetical protein n=1 Tax=Sorangium sp. So ce1099 TaxID=3133331 RepID=UPI003F5DCB9F
MSGGRRRGLAASLLLAACSPTQRPAPPGDRPDARDTATATPAPAASAAPISDAPISDASLRALAAARPMSEETVAVFRRANAEGYFGVTAVLLADNGSPRALDLLEEMFADRAVPAARRIDAIRLTVYPHRVEPPVLELAGRLLAGDLDDDVATALVESIFDDGYTRWFPPSAKVAQPPPWDGAPPEAARLARALAAQARARGRLPAALLEAISRTEAALPR